jgi:hypothetical protein
MSKLEELRRKSQERLQAARNRLDETRERLGRVEDRLEDTRARLTNRSGLDERSSRPVPIEHRDAGEHLDRKDPQSGSVHVSNDDFPGFGNSSNQQAKRKALFIGNNTYDDSPLFKCVNDAKEMERAFAKLGYQTTLQINQTSEEMLETFKAFKEAVQSEDEVVISFAGHGAQINSEVHLVSIDGAYLNLYEYLDMIEQKGPKMTMIIIDACRVQDRIPLPTLPQSSDDPNIKYASGSSRWFHSKVRGRASVFATSHNSRAQEPPGLDHGIFTYYFLKELNKPGRKPIRDVITRVRQAVAKQTNDEQIVSFHDELSGEFYFSR